MRTSAVTLTMCKIITAAAATLVVVVAAAVEEHNKNDILSKILLYQKKKDCGGGGGDDDDNNEIRMYSINCVQLTVANNDLYANAPLPGEHDVLFDYQALSETYTTTRRAHLWVYSSQNLHYIKAGDLVNLVGELLLQNTLARTEAMTNMPPSAPHDEMSWRGAEIRTTQLENIRIFTVPFVEMIRNSDLHQAPAVDADLTTQQDVEREYATYYWSDTNVFKWTEWTPISLPIETLDSDNLRTRAQIAQVIPDGSLFVMYPPCLDGLASVLQPWIIEQLRALINSSLGGNVILPAVHTPSSQAISIETAFREVFAVVSDFARIGGRSTVSSLDVRSVILPFMKLARIDNSWIRGFLETVFTKDLSEVIAILNWQFGEFRNRNIEPAAISDMIVFLFGGILNASKDSLDTATTSRRRGAPVSSIENSIYNQLRRVDTPHFFITKIRTSAFDPIFLIAQRHLSQACRTSHMTPDLKFRTVNLLYSAEEKTRLYRLIQDRQRAMGGDDQRIFVNLSQQQQLTQNFICNAQKEIRRIPRERERLIAEMDFASIIKYPSRQTLNSDNCAAESVQFMKNIDAYSTLFAELVSREMYGVNNIICSVRPIINNQPYGM